MEEKFGTEETADLVDRFWQSVGEGKGESYLNTGGSSKSIE